MSLKFIHTADVHLGAKFLNLGERASSQREKIKQSFTRIIDNAIEKKVDAVLVAGDLFDNVRPSEKLISFVKKELTRLSDNGVWTIILPGTHDRLEAGSVFRLTSFSGPYIHVFNNPGESSFSIQDLDVTFYANPNLTNKSAKTPLPIFEKSQETQYHVALAHGSFQIPGKSSADDYPISEGDIAKSGMNYIALGHWHKVSEYSSNGVKAWYCGSPELTALDQLESGNVLLVEIDAQNIKVKKLRVGETVVKDLEIDISDEQSAKGIEAAILKHVGDNVILKVRLKGIREEDSLFDVSLIQDSLMKKCFFLDIEDDSILSLSSFDASKFPEDLILGKFISKVAESELSDEEKTQTLKFGIPLLKGKRIL